MATVGNRSYRPIIGTLNNGMAVISGYFEFNGTSNPTTVKGNGFTVAYTSTGKWTVTLDQYYKDFYSITTGMHFKSDDTHGYQVEIESDSLVSAKTVVFKILAANSVATPATLAGNGISFSMHLQRSSYSGVGG